MNAARRYLLTSALLCLVCALAQPRSLSRQPDDVLWSFASLRWLPYAAVLVQLGLAAATERLASWSRSGRVLRWTRARRMLAASASVILGALLFVWQRDTSASGDYRRVLHDITRGVWLLKAEPLGPASFQVLAAVAQWLQLPPVMGLQGSIALLSAGALPLLWRAAQTDSQAAGTLRGLRCLAIASCGSSALYFGHIETYTLPVLVMLAYLVTSRRALDGDAGLGPPCVLFSLACALHMQMLCLGPSLLVLLLASASRRKRWQAALLPALCVTLALLGVQLLCLRFPPPYAQFFGGGDATMLIPLTKLSQATYWISVFNRLMLFAPAAIAALVWTPRMRADRAPQQAANRWEQLYVPALVAPWLLFVLLWNADLGAWRDWDLYAAAGIPLMLGALTRMQHHVDRELQPAVLVGMICLNVARTMPFVLDNHRLVLGG